MIFIPLLAHYLFGFYLSAFNLKIIYIKTLIINAIIQIVLMYNINLEIQYMREYHILFRISFALICFDLLFGSLHYMLHKYFWKYHKKHHELLEENLEGYNGKYSSIPEHIFLNLLPAYLSCLTFSKNEKIIWFTFLEINSAISHYNFNSYHKVHHMDPTKNFSTSLRVFDSIKMIFKKLF